MTYYNENTVIFHNGKLMKAADTRIDLYSQSMHYGYAVFEGIRSYRTRSGQTRIFKAEEHYDRLRKSAEALNMPYPWSITELIAATYTVLEANGQQDAYIRPLVYAPANMSFSPNTESFIAIETWEMKPFLGEKLLRVMSSSFQRPNPGGFKIQAKAAGHYVNSILASQEAKSSGYDEALLDDLEGYIAEGPGANIFFEKDGILHTPAEGNILPGITRATVLELAAAMGLEVSIRKCTKAELKQADAAFFCGTAAEVIGWESIDEYRFPLAWKNTLGSRIQDAYKECVTADHPALPGKMDSGSVAKKAVAIG